MLSPVREPDEGDARTMHDPDPGTSVDAAPNPEEATPEVAAPDRIVTQAALLAGLCRLVPIPFLDDFLLTRALAHLVGSLLAHHEHPASTAHARPLYDEPGGCLSRTVWFLVTLPFRLVFKLIAKLFKTIFFFLALREAALQIGRAALLGRTVDRALREGRLPAPTGPAGPSEPCWEASARLRAAFDQAFAGSDWHLLQHVVLGVLRGAKGLLGLGLDVARRLTGKAGASPDRTADQDVQALNADDRAQVEGLTGALQSALDQPEVGSFLDAFDHRLEAAWRAAASTPGTA